jgi:hypothetical protein
MSSGDFAEHIITSLKTMPSNKSKLHIFQSNLKANFALESSKNIIHMNIIKG